MAVSLLADEEVFICASKNKRQNIANLIRIDRDNDDEQINYIADNEESDTETSESQK